MRWLEMLATAIYVFEITRSPLTVAMLTVLRMLPLALLGAIAGAVAERWDRRRLQLAASAIMVVLSLLQALLALYGALQLWHLAVGALLGGVFWTIDMPARRTLLGDIAGARMVGPAMSLDSVTANGTRMLGPLLGGLLLQSLGLHGTFFLGAGFYLLSWLAMASLRWRDPVGGAATLGVWRSMLEGIGYVRNNRSLAGTLMITLIYNLWGFPFTAMVPVIGREVFDLSPFPVGVLSSMEGAGACVGAMAIAFFAPTRSYRVLYFFGTVTVLMAVFVFAQTTSVLLAGSILICAGFGAAAFSSMQATLAFLAAPPEIRRRIMGVLSVCIGVGPIGFVHVGLLANWLGAGTALSIITIEGLIALALVYWLWPEVR